MTPSPLVESTIIGVNDRDIDHFVLQLRERCRVSGRVTFEGSEGRDLAGDFDFRLPGPPR